MTTFVYTWNSTFLAQPADNEDESLGAQRIRDTKSAVGERVAVDHSLAGDANDGKHLWATLRNRGSTTPMTLDAGDGRVFGTVMTGNTELFYQDSTGRVLQLTNAGTLNTPNLFPSGTNLLFVQASVPAGWTLRSDLNDALIRVVNTTGGGTGGSWTISGVTTQAHALVVAELPPHDHGLGGLSVLATGVSTLTSAAPTGTVFGLAPASSVGASVGHTHGVSADGTWRPAYVNSVVGQKT